jgi:uncharacterized protein (TIGR02996 family)
MTDSEMMAGFTKALKDNPRDHDTRLVFADWLEERGKDDEAMDLRKWTPEWQDSVDWMHSFVERANQSYEYVMTCAKNGQHNVEEGFTSDEFSNAYEEDEEEFWKHYQIITRTTPEDEIDKHISFYCSC